MQKLYGGIEAGGTKFVCAVASGPGDVKAEVRFPTTEPQETLSRCVDFFRQQAKLLGQPVEAVGIACFGPIDLNPRSPGFGGTTTTPKPGWADTQVAAPIRDALQVPVAFDHDVVVAAIGEGTWGAARGLENFVYITVGTGIGAGVIANGKPQHGLVHPEMGHLRIPHDHQRDPFEGQCPYHGDCLEGLACGPAIQARWGIKGQDIPPEHPAWELEAEYLAAGLHNLVCALSPELVIMGGGVMEQAQLFPLIREKLVRSLNGYVSSRRLIEETDQYVVPPALGNQAGALGCIAMAMQLVQ